MTTVREIEQTANRLRFGEIWHAPNGWVIIGTRYGWDRMLPIEQAAEIIQNYNGYNERYSPEEIAEICEDFRALGLAEQSVSRGDWV